MSEIRRWASWGIAALAVAVMVVGLLPTRVEPVTNAERVTALASNLRCPFCQGESIADAPSQVARDLETFIVEKVDEGWTDTDVYTYFEARYGEQVRLDPPLGGWAALLWIGPLMLLVVGVVAIISRRRREPRPESQVSDPVPARAAP